MGRYTMVTVMGKELKEDEPVSTTWIRGEIFRMATEAGYHPVIGPDVSIEWHEITESEAFFNPVWNGFKVEAGDWRVRAIIEVEEDFEI